MTFLSILAFILSFVAIQRTGEYSRRITALEKRFSTQDDGILKSETVDDQNPVEDEEIVNSTEDIKSESVVVSQENEESSFVRWLKEDWLLKLGGVLVIMGLLFFLSLAFTQVGPQGKVTIGYVFGLILMVFGFKYAKNQIIAGSALHLVGAVVVIITTYTARLPGYNLFDPYFATLLMFMTSTCVALTAFAYKRIELAHLGLCMSVLVPVLVTTGSYNFFSILLYLGAVTIGILFLAIITEWRTLVLVSLVAVFAYSSAKMVGIIGVTQLSTPEMYLVILFAVLFYITSIFSIVRSKGTTGKTDGLIALLNACFALTWILSQVSHEFAPIVISIVALCYALGFFLVYKITNVYTSFIVYGGVAVGLLTTALMIELSGRTETFVLLLIGSGVTWFTYYLSRDETVTKMVSLFHVLPLAMVLKSIALISYAGAVGSYSRGVTSDPWSDMFIVATAIILYFSLYRYFSSKVRDLSMISLFTSFVLSVVIIWQGVHLLMPGGFGTFISILIYTVLGLLALFHGTQEKNETKIKFSRVWLVIVAARVIFWDAWQTGEVFLGVLICVVIGILLLSSAFVIKKVSATK